MIEKAVHYGGRSVVKACLDGRVSCVIEACSDSLLAVCFLCMDFCHNATEPAFDV